MNQLHSNFMVSGWLPRGVAILMLVMVCCGLQGSDYGKGEINPRTLSGGETTVFDASRNAFTFSARNLHPDRKA
ncbi:MAG: hypothetical protein K0Q55_3683, partial [Verrucomicrobia bacterium]|nr:hypothetical protein [Verrucomicrobiota bacterium]